jgi:integrase
MVLKQHAEIGKRSRAMANSTMKALRAVFNYATEAHEDVFLKNPVRKLSTLKAWYTIERRETFIQTEDLKTWFDAVDTMENRNVRMLLLFLLFTGARKGEATSLKWSDLNFKNDSVTIRETKSGKALSIPVAKYIMDELRQHKTDFYSGENSFVFASYGRTGHLVDLRRPLRKAATQCGISVMPHDLRRGVLTYLKNLKVDIFTRKRLVNHAMPDDVTEGYTIHTMESLRLDVERLADYILRLANPDTDRKVVQLRNTDNK